jgi:GTP cyclohydrolase I
MGLTLTEWLRQCYAGDPTVNPEEAWDNFRSVLATYSRVEALTPLRCFPAPSRDRVVFRRLPFHSLCAHHLLPFFGEADIAYEPAERIAGLSSVAKALREASHRLGLQEQLGASLADFLHAELAAPVAVRLRARQMCMEMRGAESPGTIETVALRGGATMALLGE